MKYGKFVSTGTLKFTDEEIAAFSNVVKEFVSRNQNFLLDNDSTEFNNDDSLSFSCTRKSPLCYKNKKGDHIKFQAIHFSVYKNTGYIQMEDKLGFALFDNGKVVEDKKAECPQFQYTMFIRVFGSVRHKYKHSYDQLACSPSFYFGTDIQEDFQVKDIQLL